MIHIYYRTGDTSSTKALQWFKEHDIAIKKHKLSEIPYTAIFQALLLSGQGIEGLVKYKTRIKAEHLSSLQKLYNLSLKEGLYYLTKNSELLHSPIILDQDKVLIGYHVEDIRQFLPTEYRKLERLIRLHT